MQPELGFHFYVDSVPDAHGFSESIPLKEGLQGMYESIILNSVIQKVPQ